ncbi:hypothetical protein EAF00_002021 [Botryotinia globosa]|nr:hypothetical protein EAF00_002021 [Botryotinia globosa]
MLAATEVDIKSGLLKEVLLEIFNDVEGLSLNKTPAMCPPELLFHAKDALTSRKLEEKQKDDPNQILMNEIGTALQFINEDFGPQIQSLEWLLNDGEITYDLLWALMKSGDYVATTQFRLTFHGRVMADPEAWKSNNRWSSLNQPHIRRETGITGIDPAFQSRIHFSIHYPDLTESGRVTVWTNFIDTMSK